MSFLKDLRHKPPGLTVASKYTALNGIGYLVVGVILIVWPGVTQTLFREPAFAGHEQALMRVIGLTVAVIGWVLLWRSLWSAAIHCRFSHRPIDLRPRGLNPSRHCRGLSSLIFDVHHY
jgi:hypothetical protein